MANILDNAIGFFSPQVGFQRAQARARMMMMEQQTRRYEGAADGRRHAGWMSQNPSVNQLIERDHKKLVQRSRELAINNPYAKSAPQKIANNVVGTGIVPTPVLINSDPLKRAPQNGDVLLSKVKDAWNAWAEKNDCDFDGNLNFYGIQHLVMRTLVVSGEALILKRDVKTDVNPLGLQIQVLEGDFIDNTKNNELDGDGGYTLYGIKFSKDNKKQGYWIYDRHPSETSAKSSFINGDQIIHVYDAERAGQMRGVPIAASTILKQRDLDEYEDAELMGKKSAACFAGFVTNASPEAAGGGGLKDEVESIEPGMMQYLNPGEQITFNSPPQNPGYSDYTRTQHRAIANGYGMSYEQFTGDLSNVNFSSGRMGWIEFHKQVEYWQYTLLIPNFCDKVFAWFAGKAKVILSISSATSIAVKWSAPRRQMIDPKKEIDALRIEARAGLISWQEIIRQNGYNPEEMLAQMIADQAAFKSAGLMPDSNPVFELEMKAKLNQGAKNTDSENDDE